MGAGWLILVWQSGSKGAQSRARELPEDAGSKGASRCLLVFVSLSSRRPLEAASTGISPLRPVLPAGRRRHPGQRRADPLRPPAHRPALREGGAVHARAAALHRPQVGRASKCASCGERPASSPVLLRGLSRERLYARQCRPSA
jgi:hypothetical protein